MNIYVSIKRIADIKVDCSINFPLFITRLETKKAYTLLSSMFNKLQLPFDINNISYETNGKPYLINSNIKFNYSHSKNYIACVISDCNVAIDIEDEFNISYKAKELYLNGVSNARKSWVIKEAYCKLIGTFNDEIFKKLDINKIEKKYYDLSNDIYDCILFYEKKKKVIIIK